jgi:hypothetical protein
VIVEKYLTKESSFGCLAFLDESNIVVQTEHGHGMCEEHVFKKLEDFKQNVL